MKSTDMKLLVLLATLTPLIGQSLPRHFGGMTDSLPPAPQLHAALDTFAARSLAAQLGEFEQTTKGNWMNYTPSVGIGYNLQGKPRPTISFSLSQIFSAQRQRSGQQAKRRSLEASAILDIEDEHRKLDGLLRKLELMALELETMRQVHDIETSLYELAVIDYEAAKLAPSGFLPKKKAFLESSLNLQRKEIELRNLEAEILTFSHF